MICGSVGAGVRRGAHWPTLQPSRVVLPSQLLASMGFRCSKDPALLGQKGKPEYQKLRGGPCKDPRTQPEMLGKAKVPSHKRKVYPSMPVPKLRYDSKSLGPAPRSYLLIRGFSSLITARHLQTTLSTHGSLEVCELAINDQMVSLGAARVKFVGKPGQSHKIASTLLTEGIKIEGERVQIEWDESKAKFNAIMYEAREKLQKEIRHTMEVAKRQKDAEQARLRNRINERARKERHIFIRPANQYTLSDLRALIQLPIEESHNGFVLFFESPELLTRTFGRIQALHCNGASLSVFARIRNPIDRPSSEQHRGALMDTVSPDNVHPTTGPYSARGPGNNSQESMADMMRDLKKRLQNDILNKVVMPAIVKSLNPKNYEKVSTQTFIKRKPEKLGDLRLHFQRKRPKLECHSSTDSPYDKLPSEDVHMDSASEEASQTAPSSVEEQPLETAKKADQDMVDDIQAEMNAELSGDNNNFELETALGTVRAPLPIPIVEQVREPHLYLSSFERLLIDEQDFLAAKKLLASSHHAIKPQHFEAWTSMYRELEARHRQACVSIENVDEHMLEPTWTNGYGQSWKTRGYQPIDTAKKVIFLPHRRKVARPHQVSEATSAKGANLKQANREARSSSRRQVRDLSTFETDSLSFNQLLRQSKKVRFAQSSIHNWGLYASEPISTNEMIIEYVGQVIRSPLADIRERHYCLNGIGSSYLFRVDQDMVIDATKRGNIARLINHSCTPSCIARVIKVGGEKRICIYAAKPIYAGDELTYDYRFEREDDEDRIPCLCGTINCKGYLN